MNLEVGHGEKGFQATKVSDDKRQTETMKTEMPQYQVPHIKKAGRISSVPSHLQPLDGSRASKYLRDPSQGRSLSRTRSDDNIERSRVSKRSDRLGSSDSSDISRANPSDFSLSVADEDLFDTDKDRIIFEGEVMKFKPGISCNFISRYVQISERAFRYYRSKNAIYTGKPIVAFRKRLILTAEPY